MFSLNVVCCRWELLPSAHDSDPIQSPQSTTQTKNMGRGVSSGGGESSLGYLFGGGEEIKKPAPKKVDAPQNQAPVPSTEPPSQKPTAPTTPAEVNKQTPAGVPGNTSNNYFRADGQNCGNFLTDRPSTKVHAAPGGGSSLDYLFGGGSN
ncbi:SPIRAL1-like1 [Prunus dulcis]|uniref:SPIRAL1-like1 n=3 Tax=Prunus TaxID=3754 RepID=A0A4Y1RIA0_PRUDU|nr:SPIRAL1-like1 [Prunus dulcis]